MAVQDGYMAALERRMEEVYRVAEGYGLDPFPIHWEIVPAEILYEFGAYGLPGRFAHWTHGRAYHRQKTMYDYGLSKIYELVINADPAYAFLLSRMDGTPGFPTPLGVLRAVDAPRYEAGINDQLRQAVEKKGRGDLAQLLQAGDTWQVR